MIGAQSACYRIVTMADGTPGGDFYCDVHMDLTDPIMRGLR